MNERTIESILQKEPIESLYKWHERLVDKYDDDRFQAAVDLDLKTYRGRDGLTHHEWGQIIRIFIQSKEENEELDQWDGEPIKDEPSDQEMMAAFGTKWHDGL